MSEKLPRITGKQLLTALATLGFEIVRIRGSHHFLRHRDGLTTIVPVHAKETIGPGLLGKILRDCKEQCVGWLKECRRIGTRFEKLAINFLAMVKLAMIQRYLRFAFSDRALPYPSTSCSRS